jgi:hypothetical protein
MMGNTIFRKLGITLARRSCAACGRTAGVKVWPWSGGLFVTTHVICGRCLHLVKPAISRAEEIR